VNPRFLAARDKRKLARELNKSPESAPAASELTIEKKYPLSPDLHKTLRF
jgi:hypothetical protein